LDFLIKSIQNNLLSAHQNFTRKLEMKALAIILNKPTE
jgi:hypothetical protein